MHLSRIDLNLFTVFDAIYREGGITPASKRLHLSQPAVSHALARLRELLDDPLFERHGNEMIPTPKARALAVTISQSLGSIEQMLQRGGHFDAAVSQRSFTIASRESQEVAFMPALVQRVAREAAMQSRRVHLPEITTVGAAANVLSEPGMRAAEPGGAAPTAGISGLAVGPEGGFTDEELAVATGCIALPGGVLRTETAAIAAGVVLATVRTAG